MKIKNDDKFNFMSEVLSVTFQSSNCRINSKYKHGLYYGHGSHDNRAEPDSISIQTNQHNLVQFRNTCYYIITLP